ncbi:MAG: 3-oxoacyl-ACP reductase FabG, partial [Evtepia sp.]
MKTVLITGGSRGIGAAAVRLFAQAGYAVALNYNRSEQEACALTEELNRQGYCVAAFKADVSRADEVQTMVDNVLDKFCQLDILLCNAGIDNHDLFGDLTYDRWRHIFAVNLDGMFLCCQAILPHFIHKKAGCILTLSSIWGMVGASCEVAYSASKAAVIGFTKALAKELGPSHITVNCVAPGIIDTEMNKNLSADEIAVLCEETPLGRLGTANEVAQTLLFLASERANFIT